MYPKNSETFDKQTWKKKKKQQYLNQKQKLAWKNFGSIPTTSTNSRTRKNFTLGISTIGVTNEACTDVNQVTNFNSNKQSYYRSTCTKLKTDHSTSKN